jgi:excisionase family DNA binding protein
MNNAPEHYAHQPSSTQSASFQLPFQELLDVKRAAKVLGLSHKTLRDHILHRRVEFVKIGGRVLFRPEKLLEFIEHNTVPARVQ